MDRDKLVKVAHSIQVARCKRLLKKAQDVANTENIDYVARRKKLKLIIGSLLGAYVGTSVGSGIGGGKGALWGAGLGALGGLGTAHISNKLRDYAGLDPMGQVVTVGRV